MYGETVKNKKKIKLGFDNNGHSIEIVFSPPSQGL
jgi:hypothetical protein